VVLANIGARVLRSLSGAIRDRLSPGGLLVLAGLLDAQADEVVADYPWGREVARRSLDGWAVCALRTPA
jgi:ribosomal protein L11 methylase PrmA